MPPPLYWASQAWSVNVAVWDSTSAATLSVSVIVEQSSLKPMSLSVGPAGIEPATYRL